MLLSDKGASKHYIGAAIANDYTSVWYPFFYCSFKQQKFKTQVEGMMTDLLGQKQDIRDLYGLAIITL